MKARLSTLMVLLGAALSVFALAQPARAADTGWTVSYDDKGGVTAKVGDKVVFTDSNLLTLITTTPWHAVYCWSSADWAANMSHVVKVEKVKGTRKVVTFTDPSASGAQFTKEVTEVSPRELRIALRMTTAAGAPGNLLDYAMVFPGAVFYDGTVSTDGNGYPLTEVSPMTAAWGKTHQNGNGDDMRYNVTTATFGVKDLDGAPGTIEVAVNETPVSPGTPPNVRGWRLFNGKVFTGNYDLVLRNTYEFPASAPFERSMEVKIKWKNSDAAQ